MKRKELIKKSIKVKAYKYEQTIFVNILSMVKPYSFCCKFALLDLHLKALSSYPVVASLTLDKKDIDIEAIKYVHCEDGNSCQITLHNGTVLKGKRLDYESISPTLEELKDLILDSIEDF